MQLPLLLEKAIEEVLGSSRKKEIKLGREELSDRYRTPKTSRPYISKEIHHAAYLAARMPATFAAVAKVLEEIRNRLPSLQIESLLDLGTGPGTALFAALEIFPEISHIRAIEKDKTLLGFAKRLFFHSQPVEWVEGDLEKLESLPSADLTILSYSVGELSDKGRERLIALSAKTSKALVVIEPGTPVGFERIRKIRRDLIEMGKKMIAPCPHELACPIVGDNWCHFAVRLQRSSLHREVKGGALGYEDEKFSYVAVSDPLTPPLPIARILRHPQKRSGHVILNLCTKDEGLQEKVISKRTPELYKETRDAEWGDPFPKQ